MKKLTSSLILFGLGLAFATACAPLFATPTATPTTIPTITPTPTPTATPTPQWTLAWADEFEQPDGSAPNPKNWGYSKGGDGWGNGEKEYYTDELKNAYIKDNMLVIEAIKEYEMGQNYTSARLNSLRRAEFAYGRIEVRAKLPNTKGIWPAIWMLPAQGGGWPGSGEIDIMEMIGPQPGRVYGTMHYGNPHESQGGTFDLPAGSTFDQDFHTFAIEWQPGEIRWFVDNNMYFKGERDDPFDKPFYFILNVAVGGYWPGNPDESSVFPQRMVIDYVRVYQVKMSTHNDWRQVHPPARIVCTTTESVDILYRLGLGERIVGVSGFTTQPPEARRKPHVGSYTEIKLEKIKALKPDLVVTFSDLQAGVTRDLVQAGFTVFTLNQRSLRGILEAILMLGSLAGAPEAARRLVDETQRTLEQAGERAAQLSYRPSVYFEEWHDPLISGIGWVGELVELAGGRDVFPDVKGESATERIVAADEVARRDPEMIIASWCGKKVNMPSIYRRAGWERMAAVRNKRVYEIQSAHILQPGPAVLQGLAQMQALIMKDFPVT